MVDDNNNNNYYCICWCEKGEQNVGKTTTNGSTSTKQLFITRTRSLCVVPEELAWTCRGPWSDVRSGVAEENSGFAIRVNDFDVALSPGPTRSVTQPCCD